MKIEDGKYILLENIGKIHTTLLGAERITKNLNLENTDPVEFCRALIVKGDCEIYRSGKNLYCRSEDVLITVNAHSYTIITAHRL